MYVAKKDSATTTSIEPLIIGVRLGLVFPFSGLPSGQPRGFIKNDTGYTGEWVRVIENQVHSQSEEAYMVLRTLRL